MMKKPPQLLGSPLNERIQKVQLGDNTAYERKYHDAAWRIMQEIILPQGFTREEFDDYMSGVEEQAKVIYNNPDHEKYHASLQKQKRAQEGFSQSRPPGNDR